MLNNYLQFAKTQATESTSDINLKKLFDQVRNGYETKNLQISQIDQQTLYGACHSSSHK